MSYHTSDLSLTSLFYGKSINQSSNHLTAWLRYSSSCFWFLAAECSPTWHNIQNKNYDFYLKLSDLFLSWSYTSAFNIHLVAQGGKKNLGTPLIPFGSTLFPLALCTQAVPPLLYSTKPQMYSYLRVSVFAVCLLLVLFYPALTIVGSFHHFALSSNVTSLVRPSWTTPSSLWFLIPTPCVIYFICFILSKIIMFI